MQSRMRSCSTLRGVGAQARLNQLEPGDDLTFHDYRTVLYRQNDGSCVAEVPAIPGCYALMPTREEALADLAEVFGMIAAEYREKNLQLPADTTEIVHAWRHGPRVP